MQDPVFLLKSNQVAGKATIARTGVRVLRNFGFVGLLLAMLTTSVGAKTLPIPPVSQALSSWCWLAAGEMVFRYYHVPNINPAGFYQCGIAAAVFGGPCMVNCTMCNTGSGPAQVIRDMLVYYPRFVRNKANLPSPNLTAEFISSELSEDDVRTEIDEGRPIIAGISPHSGLLPPGLSEHAVLIVGYNEQSAGLSLIINDPFPYDQSGVRDPYTATGGILILPGRYRIRYDVFVNDLSWGNTISGIDRQ